jgi:hypothetical protein
MKTRKCSKCKKYKLIKYFYKRKDNLDGYRTDCKKCVNKQIKKYCLLNKEKINERKRKYYQTHKEKWIMREKLEKVKKQKREYMKKYHKTHSEYIKNYRKLHKKEKAKYQKQYNKNRKMTDINYKVLCYLRTRIWEVLKGNPKAKTTMKLVGCSLEKLKQHLESQFTKGMSWANYGKWHIDHIRPCASFDLSKPSEQRKCFNYTNLRPLWAKDNLKRPKKRRAK